jgi:5-methylcytosine-specific restriction endonuclease McrA
MTASLKTCSKCGVAKVRTEYYRDRSNPDGLDYRCSACARERSLRYHAEHADVVSARRSADRAARPDHYRARDAAHRERLDPTRRRDLLNRWKREHTEAVAEHSRKSAAKYRKRHPDRVYARQAAWAKKHPEFSRAKVRRRHAIKMNASGSGFTKTDEAELLRMQNWRCFYCDRDLRALPPKQITADHVIPLRHGGAHDPSNIVMACKSCNSRKGAKLGFYIMTPNFMHPDLSPTGDFVEQLARCGD